VIRRDIQGTRERLGDTVDALSYKADVKERARDYVGDKTGAVTSGASSVVHRVTDAADSVVHKVSGTAPSPAGVRDSAGTAAERGKGLAQENPIGLAIAGVAVGFLVGLALPSTRVEDERIGPVADEVKELAKETGHEAVERGKVVAEEVKQTSAEAGRTAVQDIAETVKEQGQEQGQELLQSTRSQAQDAAETVRGAGAMDGPSVR
jgi:gas vesicle protein